MRWLRRLFRRPKWVPTVRVEDQAGYWEPVGDSELAGLEGRTIRFPEQGASVIVKDGEVYRWLG